METLIDEILAASAASPGAGDRIGRSREGRPIHAFVLGKGSLRVSLIAGCHADEPVGPLLLRRLAAHLSSLEASHPLLRDHEWWIIPHLNPDGEERNRAWSGSGAGGEDGAAGAGGEDGAAGAGNAGDAGDSAGAGDAAGAEGFDLAAYLTHAVREPPGDDIEFGFPRSSEDLDARPENRAAMEWWRQARGPFHLHASLHGMAFGGGPWFLIEPAWTSRSQHLRTRCSERVKELGYRLHDVERRGEKGFFRIDRGFATRPDSRLMAKHFLELGDEATARLFRPSSMEAIRSLGGDPLTLVSEMPLFITPGVGEELGPPDPKAEEWERKIDAWRVQLASGRPAGRIRACSRAGCLAPMPLRDQMALQWAMIAAGIEQVRQEKLGTAPTFEN